MTVRSCNTSFKLQITAVKNYDEIPIVCQVVFSAACEYDTV